MSLLETIYAGTEGLDNPADALGGMQSMPDPAGGTSVHTEQGEFLGSVRDGVMEGQNTIHDEHGGLEGTVEENVHGGQTFYDENMQKVLETRDAGAAGEVAYGPDGSEVGTVGPDGMGGTEVTGPMGEEIASSTETPTGQDIEFGGVETADIGGAGEMGGADLAGMGDVGDAAGVGDVGEVGDLGDAADVADLGGLSEVGDLGDMV